MKHASIGRAKESFGPGSVLWLILACVMLIDPASAIAQATPDFDHYRTRFPLTGAHEQVSCESCHLGGVFRGTPTRCATCHDGSGIRSDSGKAPFHIRSTNECSDCHLLAAWTPSRVDHDAVLGSCSDCHNGVVAAGKPAGHPQSSNRCEECHRTTTWLGAGFDHTGVVAGCFGCHNDGAARGKPGDHIQSSNLCEQCHIPASWFIVRFDHSGVTGSCSTCHNGDDATGMDNGHFMTNQDCGECHRQTSWRPSTFSHTSPNYPGTHAGNPSCVRCHSGNSETVNWPSPGYQPDCAGCHASRYRADEHKKVDSPTIRYTVSELRDCAGACHEYTDATFTTIRRTRSGHHRARDSEF
jgi:hypothetical protein